MAASVDIRATAPDYLVGLPWPSVQPIWPFLVPCSESGICACDLCLSLLGVCSRLRGGGASAGVLVALFGAVDV